MSITTAPYIPPTVVERTRSPAVESAALQHGYTPLQARIIAGRLSDDQAGSLQRQVRPQMSELDSPDELPDIDRAVERLVRAVVDREPILCCTDHDADGVSGHYISTAVLVDIFEHPPELVHSFISHRLKEGYGISDSVVDRIGAAGHDRGVLISVDQGSSDESRIARLRSMGIDTVVTDHHGIDGRGPPSAYACVNPVRSDSRFPDKFIAGCHVAWLTMAAVRRELIRIGHLHQDTPHLGNYLAASALGTTADCVSFARSRNNRLIVQRGLHQINTRPDPCWQALREHRKITEPFTSSTLAYLAGPMINARGRVDEAMAGVHFLQSVTLDQARRYVAMLHEANEERKLIERTMKDKAMVEAGAQLADGAFGLAIWLDEGHSGVHGVVASRVVQAFGRPTICISPKQGQAGFVTASARSVPGFHVRDAFAWIAEQRPDLLVSWGGHAGAGGLGLRVEGIPELQSLWNQCAINQGVEVGPVVMTDGALPQAPDFAMLTEIAALEPYGREFDAPVFSQTAVLVSAASMSDGKHLRLKLRMGGKFVNAVWFNVPPITWSLAEGLQLSVVFELSANTFRGETTLQLLVRHAAPAQQAEPAAPYANLPTL